MRQELGVDVQLSHAPGDELGELAAEVEHRHGVGLLGRLGLDPPRWRRVERLLEVGLDLRVVGREDSVAGVRRLSVDRSATLPGCDRRPAWRVGSWASLNAAPFGDDGGSRAVYPDACATGGTNR